MSFLIAAAGTGGHVFPGLSVGEALVRAGVDRSQILFVGGDRLESRVFPAKGFEFVGLQLRGLRRSIHRSNLGLPRMVLKARDTIRREIQGRGVKVVLGMGGYVTIPAALAARRSRVPLMVSEANAEAGLANRIASRWSDRSFGAFATTKGLAGAEWVGNPIRESIARHDSRIQRPLARALYGIDTDSFVLGVFGGSLGSGAINQAVSGLVADWDGPPLHVLHLTGSDAHSVAIPESIPRSVAWSRIGFEDRMEMFYGASDLMVARSGGAVAELLATGTPSVLVPGEFGSSGHQLANARVLTEAGAAEIVVEGDLAELPALVESLMMDRQRLAAMSDNALRIARPNAADAIAAAMIGTRA